MAKTPDDGDLLDGTEAVRDTDDLDVSGGVTDDPGVEEVGGHPDDENDPALDASPY